MNKFRFALFFFLLIAKPGKILSQEKSQIDEKKLQIKWGLLANNHNEKGEALSYFTIVNNDKHLFPNKGWTIFFNSSQPITSAKATSGVSINHVNGDIYQIVPTISFLSIGVNDSVVVKYYTDGIILNKTAAPSGLYIVWEKDRFSGVPLSDYSIVPLVYSDAVIMTAEKVYWQNKIIKDIPIEKLPKIFPTPVCYKETNGDFTWNTDVVLQADTVFNNEVSYLQIVTKQLFGNKILLANGKDKRKIIFQKMELPAEAYQLDVTTEKILISASDGAGIFYGIQSLLSFLPPDTWKENRTTIHIPIVEIKDAPRFAYRSLLLDVARNFKSKQTIFKVLDLMAMYKMNVLHFHFSDDEGWRVEIPALPELTTIGSFRGHDLESKTMLPPSYAAGPMPGKTLASGYYSKKDFIEILRYATERHIMVMPEIESPGHSRAAIKSMDARYEKFMQFGDSVEAVKYLLRDRKDSSVYRSAQQWTDNVMCVALPSVYAFMEKVIDEIIALYKEAGAPLTTIHIGGDEVPAGVWEKSPICQQLIADDAQLIETNDLWEYYIRKINIIVRSKGLVTSGWEEVGMMPRTINGKNTMMVNPRLAAENIQLHVWNNVPGWGSEDLPYRLANAGYKVVLSPVSNNYLDLAYYKHPEEPGYYWGGYQDIDKPFYFIPYNYYLNTKETPDGNTLPPSFFMDKIRLTSIGKSNIIGVQGLLWGENLRSNEDFEFLLLPKLLGVSERAWAPNPSWGRIFDSMAFQHDYSIFLNQLGKRELPRLDYLSGGFAYRIPSPGVVVKDGSVLINTQFPGLTIRYTIDGSNPTSKSTIVEGPITNRRNLRIATFDNRGRSSRIVVLNK